MQRPIITRHLQCKLAAISASARSPFARSFSLLYRSSSRVSTENSWFCAKVPKLVSGVKFTGMSTYSRQSHRPDKLPDRNRSRCILSYRCLRTIRTRLPKMIRHVPYLVVFLEPSIRASLSIVMAWAGQIASQSLQAVDVMSEQWASKDVTHSPMQRSSPLGYLRRACSPRKRGDRGPFSNGYIIVYGGRKKFSRTIHIPIKFIRIVDANGV